jgi:hypothetical protein
MRSKLDVASNNQEKSSTLSLRSKAIWLTPRRSAPRFLHYSAFAAGPVALRGPPLPALPVTLASTPVLD